MRCFDLLPMPRDLFAGSRLVLKALDTAHKARYVGNICILKKLAYICFGFFAFFLCSLSYANSAYPLDSAKKEAQFHHLLKNLRCLVCQNQDLEDSSAGLAQDLRLQVYHLVQEGKSDTEITDYLTGRYGDFILFNPPVKGITLLLWFGPFIFLLLGIFIFWRSCFRRVSV